MKYRIYFHDPTFFLYSQIPHNFPGFNFKTDLSGGGKFSLFFSVTQRKDLNTKSSPCIEDPGYDYQHCVRNYLALEIGCKLPWDNSQEFNECSTIDDLLEYSIAYHKFSVYGLLKITNQTKCVKPCNYKQYKMIGQEQYNKKHSLEEANSTRIFAKHYVYIAATEEIVIEKEVAGYTGLSLLADMGGSLGMFLGFSFLGAWDKAELLILWTIQAWKHKIVVD